MADSLTGVNKDSRVKEKDRLRKVEVESCAYRIVFVALFITVGVFMSMVVHMYSMRSNTCGPNLRF